MKIKKEMVEALLELSREAYPLEVGGILLNRPVDDLVILPGKFSGNSIQVYMHHIPIYPTLQGTFHSHPSPNNRPSRADLNFFSKMGREHLIISHPYNLNSIAVYDSSGKPTKLEIV